MERRYQVFISSTYADLIEERKAVIQSVLELGCFPAGMEFFPAADEHQWNYIQRALDDSDYYILVIGGRYGSIGPNGRSYTEMEFEYAKKTEKHILAFLPIAPELIPVGKTDKNDELSDLLASFKSKVCQGRLIRKWSTAKDLQGHVTISLLSAIKDNPGRGWIRGDAGTENHELG